ncbi:hypothetical protein M2139_000118 [Enterococcus sp. PF1-24]|uniref:FtsX-like permease family protein n=1 Tax=unclassified Enterococcus TaxID=2608891 RepID=UPI002475C990|nr:MULTISPECIES: FtsX-like permease family protein [unclassified Enterococcus]MDH6363143.1 hypothetical protein [Enterococcus sp. PFB1-1]MDH6400237.1 hypothetical protein [Enterococcus sp. PF1-24]
MKRTNLFFSQNKKFHFLALIFLLISFTCLIFFWSLFHSFRKEQLAIEESYQSQVSLYNYDFDNQEAKALTLPLIQQFLDSEYVKDSTLSGFTLMEAEGIEIPESNGSTNLAENRVAVSFSEMKEYTTNFQSQLIAGNLDLAADECLINNYIAEANNFSVGDQFTLLTQRGEKKIVKVAAIISDFLDNTAFISVPLAAGEYLFPKEQAGEIAWNVEFQLYHSRDYQKFVKELYQKKLPRSYQVENHEELGKIETQNLKKNQQLTLTLWLVTLLISLLTFFLCSLLSWQERSYQMRYYYSIGISRKQLVENQLAESLLLVIIAIGVSYVINFFFAEKIAAVLFFNQQSLSNGLAVSQAVVSSTVYAVNLVKEITLPTIRVTFYWFIFPLAILYSLVLNFRLMFYTRNFQLTDLIQEGSER